MKRMRFDWKALTISSVLLVACLGRAQEDVIISEFMASNPSPNGAIRDEDGEFSDWIEIFNRGFAPVNLQNWALTDDPDEPFLWRFPETNLNAGATMIVFASNKDRRVPGAPLHTSFALRTSGEYLALVRPDGSIATEFNPYPGQVPNVSYGFGLLTTNRTLVDSNAPVRVRIPANGADGTNWTTAGYNDSTWTAGVNGVGYGSSNVTQADYSATVLPTAPVGYWRFSEASGTTAANLGSGAGLDATHTSATVGTAGPRPPELNGFEPNNNAVTYNGTSGFSSANSSILNSRGAFTIAGWIKVAGTPVSRVGLFGQNDCVEFGFISTGTLQCWSFNPPDGGGSVNATFNPPLNTWQHVAAVGDGTSMRIYTNGALAATGGVPTSTYGSSTSAFNIGGGGIFDTTGNFFNGQIDEVAVYHRALSAAEIGSLYQAGTNAVGGSVLPFVNTDVGTAMSNVNASAYIRLPFTVPDPTNVALLTLRLRTDDGAVAFINGVEVARVNSPATLAFDSAATDTHSPLLVDEFRVGAAMLQEGNNVLAIQGLNVAANDEDFLVTAELSATVVEASSSTPLYFSVATPDQPNSGGVAVLGPAILDATHSPTVPADIEDIVVTARVTPTFYPVTNVVMRYRVMFGNDIEVTMFDDGLHGDGGAGDGVYGATIPASASTASQMVRWFFRATDDRGNTSRWPIFSAPAAMAEYLGTMVNYTVESKLPVIHLFAPPSILSPGPTTPQAGADSQAGARVSLFYDGELYDNVHMQLRGNTTAGFNKKSHRLEFNSEHLFRHSDEFPRISKTSFVADYGDPSYMRQGLSFWLGNLIGSPSAFYYPVRLQLNGVFYQLANHNDVHDQDLLERLGYDPNGALYNAAGRVTLPTQSTGGFEKKTRRWEGNADYNALATGIAETNALSVRRANLYDNFDIPNAINYLVTARWAHENDDIWANLSLYHDNDGDNLWRILSFDMNLSWGAIFFEGTQGPLIGVGLPGNVIGTFDAHKGHPLYGSSQNVAVSGPSEPGQSGGSAFNRVYDVFFLVPEVREMYLRRLRTMMDTYVKPPGLHPLSYPMETRVRELRDLMFEEAERDRNYWGWPGRGGQCNFDPGIRIGPGVDHLIEHFIIKRRTHFYVTHSITNTSKAIGIRTNDNAGIPLEQPADATVAVAAVEYNPGSGNQLHEYLTVTNPNPYAVDVSGWKLDGGVEFTFAPGTVIPSNHVVYVSPDVRAFKTRTSGPRGGMGLFVVGPYQGQLSARGEPLTITDAGGRMVFSNVFAGSPSLAQQHLRITEIMYHPAALTGSPTNNEEFEYIELKNISSTETLNLAGVRFTRGITFDFTGSAVTSLAPGARVLLVKSIPAFELRYGSGLNIAGQYTGNLDNSGDRLVLVDSSNEEIHDFDYEDDWYPITDGVGFSLAIVDENADTGLWDSKTNWRPSGQQYGAPGQPDPAPPGAPAILVNEVLTHTDPPLEDAIELYNPTTQPVNVGGWFLTDNFTAPKSYQIPAGTTIPAGGYLSFNESQTALQLSSLGEEAYVFSADASGNLTGYAHGYEFSAAENGVSFGRHTNSVGEVHFVAQSARTLGAVNAGPKIGPVIISEIMYHPPDVNGREDSTSEYIELQNISGAEVNLYDPFNPLNTWTLRGGVEFDFPPLVTLAANEFVLVVNFDVSDSDAVDTFRQKHSLSPSVRLFGPYGGQLNNAEDEIELKKPDIPQPGGEVPYIMVEQVDYNDEAPWPTAADGSGASLRRVSTAAYANDPASWVAAAATPGAAAASGTAPSITSQPQDQEALATGSASFSVIANGTAPLRYQWQKNGDNIEDGTSSILNLTDLRPEDAGEYTVTIFNDAGAVTSEPATLVVRFGAFIFTQPVSANKRPGESVAFSVSAFTESTLAYQWRFNGSNIPGANGSSHTISSVQVADGGVYDVVLTDDAGSVVSAPATLLVLVDPVVVQPPLRQTVPHGGAATLSVLITNTATLPIEYRWRVQNRNTFTNVLHRHYDFFTVSNITAVSNVAVGLINASRPGGVLSPNAAITPVADFDSDGMPDNWEVLYGFDTNNVGDAVLDRDGDTVNNRNEYISGTDPLNPESYLKVNEIGNGQGLSLTFNAVSNLTYNVLFTDVLGTPWSSLAPVVARTNNRIETVTDPGGGGQRFYRLVTPAQE